VLDISRATITIINIIVIVRYSGKGEGQPALPESARSMSARARGYTRAYVRDIDRVDLTRLH